MDPENWSRFDDWHALFDALCHHRGHRDNAGLASALCRQTGRLDEKGFRAAEKKLRSWRMGRRIPLRRNAGILRRLLDVDSNPVLKKKWDETYRKLQAARGPVGYSEAGEYALIADAEATPATGRWKRLVAAFGVAALPVGILAIAGMKNPAPSNDVSLDRSALPTIAYNARAFLSLGTEKLIHGSVQGCGGVPTEWGEITPRLPESSTGVFADGGLATMMMNSCGKEMVVRAIKFIAMRPGVEELEVLGAYFKIEVAAPASLLD